MSRARPLVRSLSWVLLAGALAWTAVATRNLYRAQRCGAAMAELLAQKEPTSASAPAADPLPVLAAAAGSLSGGDFHAAYDLLVPRDLSEAELANARRWLAGEDDSRRRLVALTAEAQRRETAVADVAQVRKILGAALAAAAQSDARRLDERLALAERALDATLLGGSDSLARRGPEAVAARAQAIAPAMSLARDLCTEGYSPAERVVARASECYRQRQYDQASLLLDLAGQLLGAPARAPGAAETVPEWFTAMAAGPLPDATPEEARMLLEFCQTVAQSQAVSPPVKLMLERAGRARDAGEHAAARWWASVALEALGMNDEAAAAARTATEPQS